MWEFKHGNGNFRKGDVAGLREIKRRASRHTLINRDSFSGHKTNASQPGTPAEALTDGADVKFQHLEHSLYDVHARLARMEDSNALLSSRCQALTESLIRCHQVSWLGSGKSFSATLLIDRDFSGRLPCLISSCPLYQTLQVPCTKMVSCLHSLSPLRERARLIY